MIELWNKIKKERVKKRKVKIVWDYRREREVISNIINTKSKP